MVNDGWWPRDTAVALAQWLPVCVRSCVRQASGWAQRGPATSLAEATASIHGFVSGVRPGWVWRHDRWTADF